MTASKEEIHFFKFETEQELRDLSRPVTVVKTGTEGGYHELRETFFTPGIHFTGGEDGGQVTFVRQLPLFETQTTGSRNYFPPLYWNC